jgi:UDP-N-acetylmuramoyl-tripeptide--D-alanyl-D-alanine ligase
MEISELHKIFKKSSGIITDSRKIVKDSLFFALKGDNFNGNQFVENALRSGAMFCIIDEENFRIDDRCILVENVLKTLQKLANYHRMQLKIKILAITGTNGKTTTKELVNCVLSQKFHTYATQGNLNNHLGVPLTLLSMSEETEVGIVEMGANHLNEIAELCEIAEPDFGLITNIGTAHIEGFGSFEGVIKTKTELYRFLEANGGTIFLNYDNGILKNQTNHYNLVRYGTNSNINTKGKFISANPYLKFKFWDKDSEIDVETNLFGNYNFENNMAAVCIGQYLDVESIKIKKAIESYFPKNNRSQIQKTKTNTLLLDMYNANPTSMKSAIDNFAEIKSENKVLIIGDMLELGHISGIEHKKIVDMIEILGFQKIFLVGKEFGKINQNRIPVFETSTELAKYLLSNKISDATILLKASRGIKLENVLEYL